MTRNEASQIADAILAQFEGVDVLIMPEDDGEGYHLIVETPPVEEA